MAIVKTLFVSIQFILVTAALSIGFGFIMRGRFTLAYVFNANFLAGALIICVALVMMLLPGSLKFDKLTDHTTFSERFMEQRSKRQKKAFEFLYLGLCIIIITGLIQIMFAAVIPV